MNVPTSVYAVLGDPTALAALESQFITAPPAWFTSLPVDAQAFVISLAPKYMSIMPQILSLEVAAGLTTLPAAAATATDVAATARATATGFSNSTIVTSRGTGSATGTTKAATASASTSKAPSTSISAGAAPTNAIAAGIVGAVGFIGLALAL
jgi:hypothetical protein